VVEGITGKRLGEVMRERIFAPLGMTSTAFTLTSDMRAQLARMHHRETGGSLTPMAEFELPQPPEVDMAFTARSATIAASSACG
jgi:methyl acetate hydrolase